MNSKALIFDMDGVLISGKAWIEDDRKFLRSLFGEKIYAELGETRGKTIDMIYTMASELGFTMGKKEYYRLYDMHAARMYAKSSITGGLDRLVTFLLSNGFVLGIVTSARRTWLDAVLPRIAFIEDVSYVLCIDDRPDLQTKPAPDGYIDTMRHLSVLPENTIILEDSNTGILAAKASGAFTIGFSEHIEPGYQQVNADVYARNIDEVISIVNKFTENRKT
ncbi:MAG TPA: HAD family phosphatase [Patescibacteria group bacterium]|nr:HAD family phosphatase [Patescibacteria group bacterium]